MNLRGHPRPSSSRTSVVGPLAGAESKGSDGDHASQLIEGAGKFESQRSIERIPDRGAYQRAAGYPCIHDPLHYSSWHADLEDKATVPLYYENRSPEVQLVNPNFDRDMERILEEAALDQDQEQRLAREFGREYHLIIDDDRLDTIATDLVDHFVSRGYQGKAMVVSIDKATAVKMYDKVQAEWQRRIDALSADVIAAAGEHRQALAAKLSEMTNTDTAVVVFPSQNEITEMRAKGVDIEPHRRRMVAEHLDVKFKDPADPLRIVFLCAMWLTGFDAPATSTIYLDKPMRNHTLMQTWSSPASVDT